MEHQELEHLVLARKFRPQKFSEVVEQKTAVTALKNALALNRLGSAYLFFGPRGVGKTTIARILAKRVNCTSPVDEEPCDKCESCLSILNGNSMDVMEIDAASHRGIDHIRELRENVKFQPMAGKKKVYIIDEVHMLTTESFNALLKTLEEPPPYVVFILATTEFSKIPETILSRCQVFTFRKVPLRIVQEYLKKLCDKESIHADDEALFWIARKGDGSMRDSLSFLEQAITFCGKNITAQQVKELSGAVWFDLFKDLTTNLLDDTKSNETIVEPVYEIFQSGGDLSRFIWEYLDFLRTVLHIREGVNSEEFLGLPMPDIHRLTDAFAQSDRQKLIYIFDAVYQLLTKSFHLKLRNSYEVRILIEIELLSLKHKLTQPSLTSIVKKLNRLSQAMHREEDYSPENELQKKFLGTVVDPASVPDIH